MVPRSQINGIGHDTENVRTSGILAAMYALEQALLVAALVGACGLAVRLLRREGAGDACHSGGSCGCDATADEAPPLTQIRSRRNEASHDRA
jgi:hypothetical protein